MDLSVTKINLLLLAYNEINTIENEIHAWHEEFKRQNIICKIIVVEDGSTDGTSLALSKLHDSGIIVHLHEENRSGYKKALFRGLAACEEDFIFFSDTGMKNDLKDSSKLLEIANKADLITGMKVSRKDQKYRILLTKSLNALLRIYFGYSNFRDVDSGFRLLNSRVRNLILKEGLQFRGFAGCEMALLTVSNGLKYAEVPVSYVGRDGISRGLPPKSIPKAILNLLVDLRRFKRFKWRSRVNYKNN